MSNEPTIEQYNELKQMNAELLVALKGACGQVNLMAAYDAHYKATIDYAAKWRIPVAKFEGQLI